MDNPDPERHRPEAFDWRWDGCDSSVEVGGPQQMIVVPLGDWQRFLAALPHRAKELGARLRKRSAGLLRCGGCQGGPVMRYRAVGAAPAVGYCAQCWFSETGERLDAHGVAQW